MSTKVLPIAFISDTNFFLPTIVAITSLLENKKKESTYRIYIIYVGFSEKQITIIREIAKKYNTEIRIVAVLEHELKEKYKNLAKHECNATISALIKFDLPNICVEEDRILYLDGDIIVKQDLSCLLEIHLFDDVYVAAVKDSGVLYSDRIIRQNIPDYFNSGVMLLNLNVLRKEKISQKLIDKKINSTDNSLMDQHIFNEVFKDKKMLLDYRFNTLYVNLRRAHYFHKLSLDTVGKFCGCSYSKWEDLLSEAVIVHFSSFDKPWKYADVSGVEIWDHYFINSIVYEKLNRKRLHTKTIEKLLKMRFTRLIGILFWEIETKGIRKTALEVIGGIKSVN